jgi:hypothetical protein
MGIKFSGMPSRPRLGYMTLIGNKFKGKNPLNSDLLGSNFGRETKGLSRDWTKLRCLRRTLFTLIAMA